MAAPDEVRGCWWFAKDRAGCSMVCISLGSADVRTFAGGWRDRQPRAWGSYSGELKQGFVIGGSSVVPKQLS